MSKPDIQRKIIEMATNRGADKTICPSEVAREMFDDNWRSKMEEIRDAAFELAEQDKVIVTQKGKEVDRKNLKGPIRIRIQQLKNKD